MVPVSSTPFSQSRSAFFRKPDISAAQTYLRAAVSLLGALGQQTGYDPAQRMLADARRAARPADLLRLVQTTWTVLRALLPRLRTQNSRELRACVAALQTAQPDARRLQAVIATLREPFLPGSELWADAGSYHHAGVYVGNGKVVNVTRVRNLIPDFVRGKYIVRVRKQSLRAFAEGRKLSRGPTPHTIAPDIAVQRALAKVGQNWNYDPLRNNCQHFSSWVVSNKKRSPEARQIKQAVAHALQSATRAVSSAGKQVSRAASSAGKQASRAARKGGRKLKKLFS